MTTPYVTGTVSVTAGSAIVTGSGTAWETSGLVAGIFGSNGIAVPVASIDSDTQITLALEWPGATASGQEYWITYDTTPGQQTVANAQRVAEYIARLNNPALAAAAGVTPAANKVLLFTGANTATLIDLEDLIQGVKFDAEVPNLAGRAAYDGQPKDFRVLVADVGDGRSAFYTKLSNASADWSVPFYISGPAGGAGPYTEITVGTTTTLPAGSEATVTPVVVDADTIRLDFGLPRGANGTGTGDVVGPASSVDGQIAAANGTTGKLLKFLTSAQARTSAKVPVGQFRNKLINPLFLINQRVVSGSVTLAAGAYGHDRMKAGSGGCSYTFSTNNGVTTLNISAGSLQQVIEASAFAGEPGDYVLSWAGTAQGRINGGGYGATGDVVATLNGSANVTVEFGVGTLSLPQLEKDYVTPFSARHIGQEMPICQRYYEEMVLGFGAYNNAGQGIFAPITFKCTKRATPTASTISVTTTSNLSSYNVDNVSTEGMRAFGIVTATGTGAILGWRISLSSEM